MINFHKYGFLDSKRLKTILKDSTEFLTEYDPNWYFIWSDLYKPEIAYTPEFTYIKYYLEDIGYVYLPPIGNGSLKLSLLDMEEDAKDHGFDFNIGAITEELRPKLSMLGYKSEKKDNLATYIYIADNYLNNGKYYKKNTKIIKSFAKAHKDYYCKTIKKEDFTKVFEFITNYKTNNTNVNGPFFFRKLNMIKKCIEHLYELDLFGMLLMENDEIYGMILSSTNNNCTHVYATLSLDIEGAFETLFTSFAKYVSASKSRYISLDSDLDLDSKKIREDLMPIRIEDYYSTF